MAKPPSWNEIGTSAAAFAARWADETNEKAEAQTFWNEFLGIFGIDRRRVAVFEKRAQRTSTTGGGFIDIFWPRTLIAEHKSAGKSLEDAEQQAFDYLESIDVDDFPGLVITSDFATMRVLDLGGDKKPYTFPLTKLPEEIDRLGHLAGYKKRAFSGGDEEAANVKAAKLMGRLYEELSRNGYEGHDASILLVRLLFLMFGDDTGMWEKGLFAEFIDARTAPDGSDLGAQLAHLFQVLDKEEMSRPAAIDELITRFPYVNGHLFSERIDIPAFDRRMRDELVTATEFDWGKISPAVFGSLFQAIKSKEARRELGEHYTTEANIMKALRPLFLDDLWQRFEAVKSNAVKLERLHEDIAAIRVLDPACGCGNFLVIAYRHLRHLELAILRQMRDLAGERQLVLDVAALNKVRIDHFFGIEIEEWPARIAETAMFLVDQQANHDLALEFGRAPDRLPIRIAPVIHLGNALRVDWETVLPAAECSYIVGNPPFVGMAMMSKEQQDDNRLVFSDFAGTRTGRLDYVACWYAVAVKYMRGTTAQAALVSTNSITQGEQARELGPLLADSGFDINFAHRTFSWSSEAPGAAAVHVVIVGFSPQGRATKKKLYDYLDLKGEPTERVAKNINIYLADSPVPGIGKHTTPLVASPKLTEGNRPQDGGGLIVSKEQYDEVATDPVAAKYIRPLAGAQDTLHGIPRWCLWLEDATAGELRSSTVIKNRLEVVAEARLSSPTESARDKAKTPYLFFSIRQPKSRWLWVPRVSSENRRIIPMCFFSEEVIAHDTTLCLDGADEYLFGILQSAMFTAWVKTVSGRLKSDIRVSPDLSYNSFPFPEVKNEAQRDRVVAAATGVLAARAAHPDSTLADLYDPLAMPPDLVKAHDQLDAAVEAMYGTRKFSGDADRLEFLFARYAELVAADKLFSDKPVKKTRKKKS